jgi:hypothetical protein
MRKTVALLIMAFIVIALTMPNRLEAAGQGIQVVATGTQDFALREAHRSVDESLIAYESGVVIDTETGLEWCVGPDRDTTWHAARSWVESLTVEGGGWRMPTRKELRTLYKEGSGESNMSPLLNTTGGFAWTGEMMGSTYAWGFCFEIGGEFWPRLSFSSTARCFAVRSRRL